MIRFAALLLTLCVLLCPLHADAKQRENLSRFGRGRVAVRQ
jgi:hypothetical protein